MDCNICEAQSASGLAPGPGWSPPGGPNYISGVFSLVGLFSLVHSFRQPYLAECPSVTVKIHNVWLVFKSIREWDFVVNGIF